VETQVAVGDLFALLLLSAFYILSQNCSSAIEYRMLIEVEELRDLFVYGNCIFLTS
jgi:hypothetical protein